MPIYRISAPNGKTYQIEGPPGATQDQVIQAVLAQNPEAGGAPEVPTAPQPRKGVLADVMGGATNLLNIGRTGIAALTGDTNVAAQAGLERQKNLQNQYESGFQPEKILSEFDKGNYLSSAGEAIKQVPSAVAGLLPSVGQEAGLAAAGRLGGGALGSVFGPAGTAVGATAGQYALPLIVNAIQALGSQAQEKAQAQIEKGEKVDVGVAELAPYAAANAALNLVGTRVAMPSIFKKAIGQKVAAEADDVARLALMEEARKVAGRGTLNTIARGALGFTVGELPTEILQDVVDRAAVGKPLTDEDALKGYRITALNMVLGAPLGGGLGVYERGGARTQVAAQDRIEQKKQADEAKAAQDKLDAETLAKKQTPEYAQQAQQAYLDAEKRKAELEAQIHKVPKGQKLTEDQRLDNQETSLALADHKTVLNNAAKEFRQFRQFLPAPAPEAIKDTTQLQQPEMFGAPAAPKAPELDMFGKPVERAAPEPQAEEQADPRQQVRMLEQLVAQYQTQVQDASPQEILNIAPKYKQAQTALEQARKDVEALPKPVEDQIAKLHQKLGVAKDKGDIEKAAALSQQIVDLQSQATPNTQQQMEMQPFKSTVTGDRQLAVRPQYAANLNLGAEEQEADVAAQQAQAEAQYRAKGTEQERQIKIAPEVRALQRIGERPAGAVSTAPQFEMFGTEPETGASAAINQIKKGLTGGEELPTAEEEKAKKPVQRGGPAPFNLYARQEGTAEPVTAESLRQRIYDLQGRDDLSDEARAFLRRAAANVSDKDTTIGNNASLFTMLDEQLGKIERSEEGTHGEGAPTKPLEVTPRGGEGEGAMAEALREAGATKPSTVTAPATSVTTPTKAERVTGTFAGKKYNLSSSEVAQALAKAKRAKYEAGIDAGLSKTEAANRARLVTQEEAIQGVMTGAGPTAVNVQGRAEPTLRTLRGPSTYAKPLSMPDALEQHLRVKEELAQEEGKQLSLFKEEELPSKALVRATPATFQRFLASKTVQELREREKEIKDETKPLEEANKVQASIAELQQQLKELTTRYEITQVAKNIVTSNAQADAAVAQYGKMQADPYFGAVLQLDAASKSEEHARLEADIAALTKMVADLPKQIKTTQTAIDKAAAKAGTPSEALKENRVKIEILTRQQKVLTDALGKLEGLQATAASVKAAKDHIDSMLRVIAAKRALDNLRGKEVSREQVVNAQTELHDAVLARRAAEANSKAKDTMRDVRDRSYATARKRQELSEQRTKAWNVLSQLPATQYRRLTPEERGIIETVSPGEVTKALEYERHLAGMNVQSLKMELGQLDKASYALEAKIKEAKAKSESLLAPGEKLTMYGEKGSVFTKPAFVGVEGFIKKQAELADKREALEIELARKEAAMVPISKGARGEAAPREVATTRAAEQAEIDRVTEATNAADSARDRIEQLKAAYKEAVAEGDTKAARAFVKEVAVARKDLADAKKEIGISQRRYAAQRKVAGEPSKLRTGTAESKAIPGVTKQTITEQRVEPKVSTEEIIKSANEMAAEKIAAGKPLTKKEIKELTLKQQQALQAAAFDRVQTTSSQVADAQIRVDALKQAQADYAAKRRATFNLDTFTKAQEDLADAQKANRIARQQAGILEDVGTVSKKEQAAEDVPEVKGTEVSGAVGDVYNEGPISDGENAPSKFYVDRTTTPLSEQAVEMAQEGRILDLAAELAKNGSTPEIRATAAKLQPLLLRTKFIVDEGVNYKGESVAGLYNPRNNAITMHPQGLTEEDVLHEMGHAATDYVLLADPAKLTADQRAARKELEALHTRITKSDSFKGEQGIDSVREFAAEVISNKDFRSKIDSVGKPTTLLQQVLGFIKRMLGMKTAMSSKEAQALVDRILAPSRKLAAKATPSRATSPDSFAKWFGNSKVVDDDGKPLVVYHGTKTRFSTFSAKQNLDAIGFWFSSKDGTAESSIFSGDSGVVIPAYLSIQNPFVLYQTKELGARMNPERALFKALGLLATEMPTRYAVKQELIRRGYDGVKITFEGYDDVHYVALKSTQIRSAVNEQNATPSMFRKGANYTSDDDLSKLAKDIVADKQGFFEKLGGEKALQFEMLTTDMRAGLREAMKAGAKQMGDSRLFQQAMFSVTKADQKMPLVLTALSNGPLEVYTDEKGFKGIRTTNENSAKEIFAAISDIPDSYGNGEAKMALATAYMIAQRAANKGLTKLDLKALEVTQEKLDAAMRQVAADPELKKALERTRSLYNKFNEGMIRFLASTGAITQKEADGFLKEGDYVPYYRVNANGLAQLVLGAEKTITIGDIRYQPHLAQLKGGQTKIIALDESLPRNTMLLVEKAMTNMATRNVGYALYSVGKGNGEVNERTGKAGDLMPIHKGDGPPDSGVIRWNQEPDRNDPKDTGKRWLRVQTSDTVLGGIPAEIIVKSLEGAHLTLPGFLKLGAIAGDFLRAGVTRTPVYLLRQLFRDPFAAAATAGLDYGPIKAIYKAGNEYLKMNTGQSETAAKLIEKGLMQSGIFTGDPDDISKFALQLASGKDMGAIDKMFAMADRQAMKADAATRALVYDNAIKNGLSEVEADMAVMESMNFHKRGLSPTVQYASRMIPFFNSQIQGLNVLYKAATGNMPFNEQLKIKQKFQNNAVMLMGMGLVYAMMMDDDKYFKNAKPKDKYSNFFIPLPGVDEPLKLPIPYEFGWFFSAAVAAADAMKAETDGPQQLRALREMFMGAIPGSSNAFVVPQIVKPIAEVWTNKSFYSGQPLESKRLEKLAPEARYYDTTTEIAKQISKLAPVLSPIQIEHIVTGYFGSLPLMAAAATDSLFKGQEAVEAPTRRLSQMPLIGSSFQRKYGGEDADVVYKLATDALQVKATFNDYKNTGKLNEAKEYFQEHRAELAVAPMALQYEKLMGNLRKQEEIIRQSKMPADKKQERIDMLDEQRQLQSERYMQAIKRAEAAVGRTTPQ